MNTDGPAGTIEQTRRADRRFVTTRGTSRKGIDLRRDETHDSGSAGSVNQPRKTLRHPHRPLEHTRYLQEHGVRAGPIPSERRELGGG